MKHSWWLLERCVGPVLVPPLLVAPLLPGCGPLELSSSQTGCMDFDYADPADPVVEWASTGKAEADVWRANVLLDQAGATFSPEYASEPGSLSVYEIWTDPATDDTFCYQPLVHLAGIAGSLQVRWYADGDRDVPYQTVTVEP